MDGDDRLYERNDPAERDEFYYDAGQDTVYANLNDFASAACEVVDRGGPIPSPTSLWAGLRTYRSRILPWQRGSYST